MLSTEQTLWFTRAFKSQRPLSPRAKTIDIGTQRRLPLVLIVDDEELVADTTVEILIKNGFRAVAAYDGEGALRLAKRLRPDYLLTDVLMPIMNGVELALAVKKMNKETKIVLFSGQAGVSEILEEAAAKGHQFEFLPKPIHPEKLVQALREKK